MPWTASVQTKDVDERGRLSVVVRFKDGEKVFDETFTTSQAQPDDWPNEGIERKLADLESVVALHGKITDGPVARPGAAGRAKRADPDREAYAADLEQYNRYLAAVRAGVAADKHPDFAVLKARLSENFQPDYLDLF